MPQQAIQSDFAYSEDFSEGLPTEYWDFYRTYPDDGRSYTSTVGASVSVESESLRLTMDITDNGGAASFSIDEALGTGQKLGDFEVSYDRFYHPGGAYYIPTDRLLFEAKDGSFYSFSMVFQSTDWRPSFENNEAYRDKVAIYLTEFSVSGGDGAGFGYSDAGTLGDPDNSFEVQHKADSIEFLDINSRDYYDAWFNISIGFDATSGEISADFDEDGIIDVTIQNDGLINAELKEMEFASFGWWTGHYSGVDNLSVTGEVSETASVLFSEDFEDATSGELPDGFEIIYDGLGSEYQDVIEDEVNNKALDLQGKVNVDATVRHDVEIDLPSSYSVIADWRLFDPVTFGRSYNSDVGTSYGLSTFGFKEAGGTGVAQFRVEAFELSDGKLYASIGGVGDRALHEISYDEWFEVRLDVDQAEGNVSLFIDGTFVATKPQYSYDETNERTGLSNSAGFVFKGSNYTETATAQFDNLRVLDTTGGGQMNTEDDPVDVLFSENFENATIGQLSSDFTVVYNGLGTSYQDVQAEDGDQFLDLQGRSGWTATVRRDIDIDLPDVFTVEADIRLQDPGTFTSVGTDPVLGSTSALGSFSFKEEGGTGALSAGIGFIALSGGRAAFSTGSSGNRTIYEIEYDEWYSVNISVDTLAWTQTVLIDGEFAWTKDLSTYDASSPWSGLSNSAALLFKSENDANTTAQFDNLRIIEGGAAVSYPEDNEVPVWEDLTGYEGVNAQGLPVTFMGTVGDEIEIRLQDLVSDLDGDALEISVGDLPDGLNFDENTAIISGTLTTAGSTGFSYSADDGNGHTVGQAISGYVNEAIIEWNFSDLSSADVLKFAYLSTDSYNGDVEGDGVTTTIRPPSGWTAILTTWDRQGTAPRDANGQAIETVRLTVSPGMQATAYREDATGRVVVAYRGTDGDGADPLPELISTSIPLGLGREANAGDLQTAINFYQHLISNVGVDADTVSFTGHSLGGMYAGFLAGATASQGVIFASGPHTAMLDYLEEHVTLSTNPIFNFAPSFADFDFDGLSNTRVTGEVLMGAVDTTVQTVWNLDQVYTAFGTTRSNWVTTVLGSGTSALLDAFGGADVEGNDLPQLTAGNSNFWRLLGDGLNPIELHSMQLHLLLTSVAGGGATSGIDVVPGFLAALFDNEISTSARLGVNRFVADPDNAGTMFRDVALTLLDERHDVFTPLLEDVVDIVERLSTNDYSIEGDGLLGFRQVFDTYDVTDAINRVIIEHAYRSSLLELEAGERDTYTSDSFAHAGWDGWQAFDLGVLGGGGWFGVENLLERLSISGRNAEDFFPSDAGSFDTFAVRAGTAGSSAYTGSDLSDFIVGLRNFDGSGSTLDGNGGDDLLVGTQGNDTFTVADGNSLIIGGDGDDTYIVRNDTAASEGVFVPPSRVVIADTGGEDSLILDVLGAYSDRIDQYSRDLTLQVGHTTIQLVDFFLGTSPRYDGTRLQGSGYIEDIYSSGRRMGFISEQQNGDGTTNHELVSSSLDSSDEDVGFLVTASLENRDLIYGSSANLIDRPTVVFGFDERDELHLSNSNGPALTSQNFSYREGSIIVDVDFDLDGTVDSFVRFAGDYTGFEVVVNASETDTILTVVNKNLDHFDQIGTNGADELIASDAGEQISGLAGDDVLLGRAGDDVLFGGKGNDRLQGWGGINELYGGEGNDIYNIWNEDSRVYEFFDEGDEDIVYAYSDFTQPLGVESLFLSSAAQRGTGNAENNNISGNSDLASVLDGLGGDDDLQAGNANDTIFGGDGNDTLFGGAGGDLLDGGSGDDLLVGGSEADQLAGGSGNDLIFGDYTDWNADTLGAKVYRIYQATLNRAPDTGGFEGWVGRLEAGALTTLGVATGFVASREFQNVYGELDDAAFVSLLYENVLDRTADAAGSSAWLSRLSEGTSREEVVVGFSESAEFKNKTGLEATAYTSALIGREQAPYLDDVYRLYQATLDRAPDQQGLDGWSLKLSSGQEYDVIARGFTNSLEFLNNYGALDNIGFVNQLYQNVLDRAADTAGLNAWVGRLEGGSTREDIVHGFAQSREFISKTEDSFMSYIETLGRDVLEAGAGVDTLIAGYGADTFVFDAAHRGKDTVMQIDPWDLLEFNGFGYDSSANVIEKMTASGADVRFMDQGVEIVFSGTDLISMETLDYQFG